MESIKNTAQNELARIHVQRAIAKLHQGVGCVNKTHFVAALVAACQRHTLFARTADVCHELDHCLVCLAITWWGCDLGAGRISGKARGKNGMSFIKRVAISQLG